MLQLVLPIHFQHCAGLIWLSSRKGFEIQWEKFVLVDFYPTSATEYLERKVWLGKVILEMETIQFSNGIMS